jgi:hypothetical protein
VVRSASFAVRLSVISDNLGMPERELWMGQGPEQSTRLSGSVFRHLMTKC